MIPDPPNEADEALDPEVLDASEEDGAVQAELLPPAEDEDGEGEFEAAASAHGEEAEQGGEVIDVLTSVLPVPAGSTGLAARDPLQAYMREISRYSLLTPEEEKELAVRYQETGDPKVAYALVTANLRLVAKIAFKYRRFYKNVLDLIQEGNIGLMKAVQKFDPYRGVRLSTYARYWIQAYVMYFLLANHRIVKVGTTQAKRKLFYNLTKETKRLRDMGFDPTPQRIAETQGNSLMPSGLIDRLDRQDQIDLFSFMSRLGKAGAFDASKGNIARVWRLRAANHRDQQFGDDRIADGGINRKRWLAVNSLVDGRLTDDMLKKGTNAGKWIGVIGVYAGTEFEVAQAGEVRLQLDGADGAKVWIDGRVVKTAADIKTNLSAGKHSLVLRFDPKALPKFVKASTSQGTFLVD